MSRPYRLLAGTLQIRWHCYSRPQAALEGALKEVHWGRHRSIEVVNVASGRLLGTYTMKHDGVIHFNHKRLP